MHTSRSATVSTPAWARLEARIALADFLERLQSFELASNQPWEPKKALHVHGPAKLSIRFKSKQS
jgi:cytochrome P450